MVGCIYNYGGGKQLPIIRHCCDWFRSECDRQALFKQLLLFIAIIPILIANLHTVLRVTEVFLQSKRVLF